MSTKDTCVRSFELGSLQRLGRPGRSVAARLNTVRSASRGGVGANTARLILSAMNPAKTSEVIASGDSDTMKKVKGIGAKTAQRIIIDLQDKVGPETGRGNDVSEISSQHNTLKNEALLALSTLGFDKARVEKTLSRILENSERDYTLEVLIKQALKEL